MKQVNLSISNFKKWIKRAFVIIGIVISICLMSKFFNYALVTEDEWNRKMWHSFYAQEEIDNIFIGSSHVYQSVNPFILDELNGESNFNVSSGNLPMNGSYYFLKEADRLYDIKRVGIEVYSLLNTGERGNLEDRYFKNWSNIDYMKFSSNKVSYIFDEMHETDRINAIFPFLRYRNSITNMNYMLENIKKKNSKQYLNYEYSIADSNGKYEYWDKGYYFITKHYEPVNYKFNQVLRLDEERLSESVKNYLIKIIEYGKANGIEVFLFVTPSTKLEITSTFAYDNYVNELSEFAAQYGIEYYDFNLCREEYLPLDAYEHFNNPDHLNTYGAEIFTKLLYQVMEQSEEENKKYFHDTWVEKIAEEKEEVYGIIIVGEKERVEYGGSGMIASNREEGLEYKITQILDNGESKLIQSYSENKHFTMPDGTGILEIQARRTGEETVIQTLRVRY